MEEQRTDESNLSSPSERPETPTSSRAQASAIHQEVQWPRPALLRGDRVGNEPLGRLPWDVWKWIAPLLFAILALFSSIWAVGHIEDTIEQEAEAILLATGVPVTELTFDANHRDLTVSGNLPAGFTAAEIENILLAATSRQFGVRSASAEDLNPLVDGPVSLTVEVISNGDLVTLTGTIPDQRHKDSLLDAAAETGLAIEEFLTVTGRNALSPDPDGQIRDLATVIELLEIETFVEAVIVVGDVGPVTGAILAVDSDAADEFQSDVPEAVVVSAPDALGFLVVEANYDGQRIVLDGTVVSASQSRNLQSSALAVVGSDNVINNLSVSNLTPAEDGADERVSALAAALETFDGLRSANATLNDSDLTINGIAFDHDAQAATTTAVDAASDIGLRPGGVISLLEIEDLPLEEQIDLLQAELDRLEEEVRATIVFESNLSTLSPAATETLDKVVEAMNRLPLPVVEVGGHTDDVGPAAVNEQLSQARADAVAAYIGQGVAPGRLSAVGFGETQPIADPTTPEGRAQNRRVELIARESF